MLSITPKDGYSILYRVETNEPNPKDRQGPYNSDLKEGQSYRDYIIRAAGLDGSISVDTCDMEKHPNPSQDAGLCSWWTSDPASYYYLFGFATLQHLRHWFLYPDKYEAMEKVGAVVGVYQVPNEYLKLGQFQACAHKDRMIHIKDIQLTQLV